MLTVDQPSLHRALQTVARIVPNKSPLPVLEGILLEPADGVARLTATNLEYAISTLLPCEPNGLQPAVLPGKRTAEWVGQVNGQISLAIDGKRRATLKAGTAETKMSGLDPEDFPPLPKVEGGAGAGFEAKALKAALARTIFAAAPDDSRLVLSGVLWRLEGGELTLAAADGYRLATTRLQTDTDAQQTAIVPAKALHELERLLDGTTHVLTSLSANGSQIQFDLGNTQLLSRLIEGQFPDYARIIPRAPKATVLARSVELGAAIRLAQIVAGDAQIIRCELTDDGLVIRASSEYGEHESTVTCQRDLGGELLEFNANARYLREAVDALDCDQLALDLVSGTSPIVLRDAADAERRTLQVVMTMHVARRG
jgi:DNA polymerase-3 subunit beta